MKSLHIVTALIEVGAGLALLAAPAVVVRALLGAVLESPATETVGRVAGAALLSLGVACWLARSHGDRSATGLVAAMLVYNTGAVAVLAAAGLGAEPVGIALWPAVGLHAAMAVWCLACLKRCGRNSV